MKQINYVLFALMVMVLSACASVTVPETPKQTVAASYITVESIADTAYLAHRDGVITTEEKNEIRDSLQQSIDYLVVAEQAIQSGEDPENQLENAQQILGHIQKLLQQRIKQNE